MRLLYKRPRSQEVHFVKKEKRCLLFSGAGNTWMSMVVCKRLEISHFLKRLVEQQQRKFSLCWIYTQFRKVTTMVSCSLEGNPSRPMADQVAVLMTAMPQKLASISREQLYSIFWKYFEQRFYQHQGYSDAKRQEVVLQRTMPVRKVSAAESAQARLATGC